MKFFAAASVLLAALASVVSASPATPVLEARAPAPSKTPPVKQLCYSGKLRIKASAGTQKDFGYVNNHRVVAPAFGVRQSRTETVLRVQFCGDKGHLKDHKFSLKITNAQFAGFKYFGAQAIGKMSLGKGSPKAAMLTNVDPGAKSALWTMNPSTRQLFPHWWNPKTYFNPAVSVAFCQQTNRLFITGDVAAYNKANAGKAVPVNVYLYD